MGSTFKILGQSAPTAGTLTTVYTVPSNCMAVISSIVICNSGAGTTFSMTVAPGGAADTAAHYLANGSSINANDTLDFTMGVTLNTGDQFRFNAGASTLSINLFGEEINIG